MVFIDTEFTDLSLLGGMCPPKLISLGAVVLDDDRYFYAELTDSWRLADCSDWVRSNVLPLLQGGSALKTRDQTATDLAHWLQSLGHPVTIVGSSQYDAHFLIDLLGAQGMPPVLGSVRVAGWGDFPASGAGAAKAAEECYFSVRGGQHHALCDALAFREGWRAGRAFMFSDPVGHQFWTNPKSSGG